EEERFGSTLTAGSQKLDEILQKVHPQAGMIPAVELARLTVPAYDTYGFPRDLIRIALIERGFGFAQDEEIFNELFDDALRQVQQASSIGKTEQKTKTK